MLPATLRWLPHHQPELSTPQQHQQKRLCCGCPHSSVFTLNHKEKSVPWSRGMAQAGGCFCQPCPGAVPAALSRTAPANTSSCLRHQLSKVSQGKIHPGLANPIPPPGHACLRLCALTPVSYGVWPWTWQFLCLGWPLQKTLFSTES